MKTLLCMLLLSATAFGQMADTRRQDHRGECEEKKIQLDRDVSGILPQANGGTGASLFPGTLLVPLADQTIRGAHYLIFQTGVESLKLFPGFQENHSAFAQASDFYTHSDAGFRAPYINFYKSRGTQLAPTPVTFTGYELDSIGGINFGGWDGEKYFSGSAAIYTQSDENWTPTSHGGHLSIYGTAVKGGNTKQIAQFGGRGPNGELNDSVIFYRGLSFGGGQG